MLSTLFENILKKTLKMHHILILSLQRSNYAHFQLHAWLWVENNPYVSYTGPWCSSSVHPVGIRLFSSPLFNPIFFKQSIKKRIIIIYLFKHQQISISKLFSCKNHDDASHLCTTCNGPTNQEVSTAGRNIRSRLHHREIIWKKIWVFWADSFITFSVFNKKNPPS